MTLQTINVGTLANDGTGDTERAAWQKANANFTELFPQAVAFSSAVPLDSPNKIMAQLNVTAPTAFTVGGAVAGGRCYARLMADGVASNAPTFAGMVEHGASMGYLDVAGVINHINFWHDGVQTFYAISQALNLSAMVPAAAYIGDATPNQVVLIYPYNLNAAVGVPPGSAFTITNSGGADTVSSVAISGNTVTLTKSRTTLFSDIITVAYSIQAVNPIQDSNGNPVSASSTAVDNGVLRAGESYLRLTGLSNLTEAAHNGGGYDYVSATANGYPGARGSAGGIKLASGQDGYVACNIPTGVGGGPMLIFAPTAAPTTYTGAGTYGIYCAIAANYSLVSNGAGNVSPNGDMTDPVPNDLIRLRRTAGSLFADISRDNGASWITIHSFGTVSGDLYPTLMFGGMGAFAQAFRMVKNNVA